MVPVAPLFGEVRILTLAVPLFKIGVGPEPLPQLVALPGLPFG